MHGLRAVKKENGPATQYSLAPESDASPGQRARLGGPAETVRGSSVRNFGHRVTLHHELGVAIAWIDTEGAERLYCYRPAVVYQ